MFGLFKKRKPAPAPVTQEAVAAPHVEPPPVAPSGPPQSMLAWHGEISQIHNEFVAYLQNTVGESQSIVATVESELGALAKVWDPAERQLDTTKELLRRAWNRAGTVLRRDKTVTEQQRDEADLAHDTAYSELEIAFQEAQRSARATAVAAITEVNYTNTVGLWEGEWQAFPMWRDMTRAALKIQQYKKKTEVPLDLLKQYHDVAQQCWQTTFEVQAARMPDMAHHIPNKVTARMKDSRRLLRDHWQWREFEESAS